MFQRGDPCVPALCRIRARWVRWSDLLLVSPAPDPSSAPSLRTLTPEPWGLFWPGTRPTSVYKTLLLWTQAHKSLHCWRQDSAFKSSPPTCDFPSFFSSCLWGLALSTSCYHNCPFLTCPNLSGEALQIAVKRREAKSKGEKERYKHLNAEFQWIARRDKKAFFSYQCKEIEENNRMGKTRDLFKKIRDTKGTFHAKMGSIKDRNGRD